MSTASASTGSLLSRRACLIAGALLPWAASAGAAVPAKGDLIEWPTLTLVDGSRLTPADWKGRPAVVVFWSTDCAYCARHNARLDKLHRQVRAASGDLLILAIAIDSDLKIVATSCARGHRFPAAVDGDWIRARLTDRRYVPMTVLIDRESRLRQIIPGELSEEDMLGSARG